MKHTLWVSILWRWLPVMALIIVAFPTSAHAQTEYPTSIVYLVRDEKGVLLDPAKLEAITTPKGEEMKLSKTFLEKPDGTTNLDVPCLASRLDLGGRPVKLSEMTLKLNGKSMRLIFNATALKERKLIDSLPFQAGTFEWKDGKWVAAKK
ncbi:MAG: hypothetical protein K8T89_08915 [Planctomycetes bacterium]|nr:hypothetical protein [Planctomycetota bacterium]